MAIQWFNVAPRYCKLVQNNENPVNMLAYYQVIIILCGECVINNSGLFYLTNLKFYYRQ